MAASVTMTDILQAHHAAETENAHVCLPCRVESYDASKQTVSARVLVKRAGFDEDGNTKYEELPIYPDVQVAFPRAGSFVVYMPVSAGSYGHLVFCDMATGEARATGQISEPQDVTRHAGGYCIFLPGGYPDANALSDHPSNGYIGLDDDEAQIHYLPGEIKIGKTATDAVVLASALQTALVTALTASVAGAGSAAAAITALKTQIQLPGFLTSISAAITKAK